MKSRIFLLLISQIIALSALPCAEPMYRNQDLWMFRAVADGSEEMYAFNENVAENVNLWLAAVGKKFKAEDVIQIVYKTPLDSLRRLSAKDMNPFARRLATPENRPLIDFLLVAKEVEELRDQMNSPWYYPTDDDDEHARLNFLLNKCKDGMKDNLAQRYAVQAVRLMMQTGDYQGIVAFWNEHQPKLPKNVLRRMTADYVGGAYERLGDNGNAKLMYIEAENRAAVQRMLTDTAAAPQSHVAIRVAKIENTLAALPNLKSLRIDVQEVVREYEQAIKYEGNYSEYGSPWHYVPFQRGDSVQHLEAYHRLRSIAVSATKNREIKDKAFWHYTAAYLYYLDGHDTEAAYHLAKAEQNPSSRFDRESIHAFRILFDTDTRTLSRHEWLANLRWLEKRVVAEASNISDDYSYYHINVGYSISYWYDVMRKVCEHGADRLVESGNTTLAMQISNYGTYRLLPLVQEEIYDYQTEKYRKINYAQLREYWKEDNYFDYRNPFFERMDSLSATQAAAFARRVAQPQDALDTFLIAGGYFDLDYIYEHVGTLYLREMDYPKACEWLERVSCEYQTRTNVKYYFRLDPFQWLDVDHKIGDNTDYKLNFARRMTALQRDMTQSDDANRRANAKLTFAIGLRNSFGRCWALTYYKYSAWVSDEDAYKAGYPRFSSYRSGFEDSNHARKAYARFDRLVADALQEFTSTEMLAQAHLRMKNFNTLMREYPDTQAAASIRGRCDTYHDYALQTR